MDSVIKVENLSKQYRIGAREGYKTFRETLVDAAKTPLQGLSKVFSRRSAAGGRSSPDLIWALKDVSFEVKQGEVVGIIGRNGAGKSTLLKILSRITEPTEGRVELRGRVGSLLEVGTGFHPELTGHENIYLYGAILGMDRWEVTRKFDEIVAFAELEKFIDTPVKKYSSGMYMRLAFAVAAHLEPEILLVDEVLAVGDAAFQKKCLGKMDAVSKGGRTVLFVSHNMPAVKSLCPKALLLKDGNLSYVGSTDEVVRTYLSTFLDSPSILGASEDEKPFRHIKGTGVVRVRQISLLRASGELATSFSVWEPIVVEIGFRSDENPITVSFWLLIHSSFGDISLSAFQYDSMEPVMLTCARGTVRVHIDPNGLVPGRYALSIGIFGRHNEFLDWVDQALSFDIAKEFHAGKIFDNRLGQMSFRYQWEVVQHAGSLV